MSCCEGNSAGLERYPGTGCCGTSCAASKTGCSASEPRIRSCFCQENVGCLDRADCGGFRPRGTAATGACPGPCQCVEEEAWNRIVPPKPNCEWLTNFSELRRQWSDHGRQNNCKCCNCKPCRTAAPCKPCLPAAPNCSTTNDASDYCQDCCNVRLSGGACGQSVNSPSTRRRECSPPMHSSRGCPPPSCNVDSPSSSTCPPNAYSSGCSSPSECSVPSPCTTPCRPPSSCQPCSPSPRPILKKRSCCQCISGYCMCQPMPRNCNCPPPVQIDARAERECSCDCPSSPECACPPSERKFPRTKVKCPNARLCCPTPRPQPGPKCCCVKCQPCLPPPCDPCTSSKCRTVVPNVKPCRGDSPCPETSPCRPDASQVPDECRPTPPCAECRKMSPACRPPQFGSMTSGSRPGSRQMRLLNKSQQPGSRCATPCGACRSTGQFRTRLEHCDNNDEREFVSRTDEGYGDDDRGADPENRGAQCHCGPPGSLGCDHECDYCCSLGCDDILTEPEGVCYETLSIDEAQCGCDNSITLGRTGCSVDYDYRCIEACNEGRESFDIGLSDQGQCGCGSDKKSCAESCDYCCSRNCDSEQFESQTAQRIGAGGADNCNGTENKTHSAVPRSVSWKKSSDLSEMFQLNSASETPPRWSGTPLLYAPEVPCTDVHSKTERPNVEERDTSSPKVTASPRSACKLLRSLLGTKSPRKYLQR